MKLPSKATLRKYGLVAEEWQAMYDYQDGKCPICERKFSDSIKPVVDHEHVKNWKKMKPESRSQYVRGILCGYCNLRRIPKQSKELSIVDIAYNIYMYLSEYETRRVNEDLCNN